MTTWPAGARARETRSNGGTAASGSNRKQLIHRPVIIAFGWDETSTTNVYPTSLGEPAAVGESPPAGTI